MNKIKGNGPQRLQKLIAATGLCSRRQAESMIAAGRVVLNGRVAVLGDQADLIGDSVLVDGRPLTSGASLCYVLLNKPVGVVTTLRDPQSRPVVTDLLRNLPSRVYPVGRLDLTTSGLLLLTNDGALAQQLAHPRHQVAKTYLVRVRGIITAEQLKQLEQGILLEDGPTAPAKIAKVRRSGSHSWFELTIHEGRNRQVRRMCEALSLPVSRLMRIGYAFLTLAGVEPGQYRLLSPSEIARLKQL